MKSGVAWALGAAAAARHVAREAPVAGVVAGPPRGRSHTQARSTKTGALPMAMVKNPDA